MNKGKPTASGNFSNVNYFQPGRQNQNIGRNNLRFQNNTGKNSNDISKRSGNTGQNIAGNNANRASVRNRNDSKNSSTKFANKGGSSSSYRNVSSGGNRNNSSSNSNNGASNNMNRSNGTNRMARNFNPQNSNSRKGSSNIPEKPKVKAAEPARPVKEHNSLVDSNSFEVKFYGTLLQNPEILGFQKLPHRPHKAPRYMLKENVLFDMTSFQPNPWDYENQQKLLKRETEFSGEPQLLFEEFQEYRKIERENMEKYNLVDKENAKKSLDDAIVFRGSCQDMCPTYERVERVFKNQVSKWEKDPVTNKISRELAIKTFMRPSGQAPPLPSDVRPPNVLQKALNHIIDNLLPKLPESQSFIWDRTRSIRQDFTFQNNYSGVESIDCHEKICRIHILSLHVMSGANDPDYQQQQEVEQFNNSLQTLTHMYDDVRSRGGFCPNEPEFRAYELLSKIKDTELDRYLQTLPDYIQKAPIVQQTIMLRNLVIHGMNNLNCYYEFFKIILDKSKTTFLMSSLAEIHFNEIRFNALRAMSRSFHSKSKKMPYITDISHALGYNDTEQFLETCQLYVLPVFHDDETNLSRVDVTALKSVFKVSQKQPYTKRIDDMINGKSMSGIVNGGIINQDLNLKQPQTLEQIARESFRGSKRNSSSVNEIFSCNRNFRSSRTLKLIQPEFHNPVVRNESANVISAPRNQNNFGTFPTPVLQESKKTDFTPSNASSFQQAKAPTLSQPKSLIFTKPPQNPPFVDVSTEPSISDSSPLIQSDATQGFNLSSPRKINGFNSSAKEAEPERAATKADLQKRLTENPQFKPEAMKVTNNLVNNSVHTMISNLVKQKVDEEKARRALKSKNKLINELSEEMFTAFMKEQIYFALLEAKAVCFCKRNLKLYAVRQIVEKAKNALKNKQISEARSNEIKLFNNSLVVPIVHPKIPYTFQKHKLQVPSFTSSGSDCFKLFNQVNPTFDLNGTIVLRSPLSYTSQWILGQFGFDKNDESKELESENGFKLHMEILPDNFEPSEYFKNISTIIIQVGTIEGVDDSEKSTLFKCLSKDAKVIAKLKDFLERFSGAPSFSFVIVYVDAFEIKLKYSELKAVLNLESLSSSGITVGFFRLNSFLLNGTNSLGVTKKPQLDFSNLLETVWSKTYERNTGNSSKLENSVSIVNNTTDNIAGSLLTQGVVNESRKNEFPSALIKRRMKHLHRVIDDSNVKRRRLFSSVRPTELDSYIKSFTERSSVADYDSDHQKGQSRLNTTGSGMFRNSELSGIRGKSSSPIILRNYKGINETAAEDSVSSCDEDSRQRLQELSELDKLADSILKS
ncbi:hypothetical protein PMKS-000236 [Pichia membranifaciens]|uniref:Uncharacterized protein n=1 Tax=Pichia membranifaciens TaxID=4926 RepID=A0A1Q2YB70_9ASCO|nr:hypothetical protein PMKS-000236 [Pichia membranifaciens]